MNQRCFSLLFVVAATLAFSGESRAQLHVIVSGGFSAAYQEILPEFEKSTGIEVITGRGASQGSGPNTIGAQIRRGEPVEVVIMSKEGLADLISEGKIVSGTAVDLAQTPLGVSVHAGAAKPDISTVEAFKQTLLHARSVTFPSSTTGIYLLTKLFPQLGVAADMAPKVTNVGVASVAKGEAEIAIQPVSELLHVPGADFVGTIPSQIQYISVFSTAMVAGGKGGDAGRRLIKFLKSEIAARAIKNSGMEPLSSP